MIHTTLAAEYKQSVTSILGLAHQHAWIRNKTPIRSIEDRHKRYSRSTEADLWERSLVKINKSNNERTNWINVSDRGNDIFKFVRYCKKINWDHLVRASQNRKAIAESGQPNCDLIEQDKKTAEGRLNTEKYKILKLGVFIKFSCSVMGKIITYKVRCLKTYLDFASMLEHEGIENMLPVYIQFQKM